MTRNRKDIDRLVKNPPDSSENLISVTNIEINPKTHPEHPDSPEFELCQKNQIFQLISDWAEE